MKIGIVGSGMIGGLLGKLWANAGHEVLFSSRHPERLNDLAEQAGTGARTGTPAQAIEFGDVILLSIPFAALPDFGRAMSASLQHKVMLETANPYPGRDGVIAEDIRHSNRGTGPYLRNWFPGVSVVRAFNSVRDTTLATQAHRKGAKIGVPLAADDLHALEIASRLVTDAGFDPVIVGTLDRSLEFDVGTPVYDSDMSGPELRQALELHPAAG